MVMGWCRLIWLQGQNILKDWHTGLKETWNSHSWWQSCSSWVFLSLMTDFCLACPSGENTSFQAIHFTQERDYYLSVWRSWSVFEDEHPFKLNKPMYFAVLFYGIFNDILLSSFDLFLFILYNIGLHQNWFRAEQSKRITQ